MGVSMGTFAELMLPRHDFIAEVAHPWEGRPSRMVDCGDLLRDYPLRDPVIESTPLKTCEWATVFAYMYRRFGPPHVRGDDYKEFSASWLLTSPSPDVYLSVRPSLVGLWDCFTPILRIEIEAAVPRRREDITRECLDEITSAYRAALLDLLRPVCVRDNSINVLGKLGEDPLSNALLSYNTEGDADEGDRGFMVKYHSSSGFSMPPGFFGGEEWVTLCTLISHLGKGDIVAGRHRIVTMLQQPVYDEACQSSLEVKRMLYWSSGPGGGDFATKVGLTALDVDQFKREMAAVNSTESPDYTVVDLLADEDLLTANSILERLGRRKWWDKGRLENLRFRQTYSKSWGRLCEVAQNDFPDDLIDEGTAMEPDLPDRLMDGFGNRGRKDLRDWVEWTLALPQGRHALSSIVFTLEKSTRGGHSASSDSAPFNTID